MEVKRVSGLRGIWKFVSAQYDILKEVKEFVPPIFLERLFDLLSNPFYEHGEVAFFIVENKGKILGRISAQVDYLHIKKWRENIGFFGFFDVVDDIKVAKLLFKEVQKFLKEKGMEKIRGPFSLNINGESGVLVEGFSHPPYILMPHNPPYYEEILKEIGMVKIKDLFAWRLDIRKEPPSFAKLIWKQGRDRIDIRELKKSQLYEKISEVVDVYNSAWEKNWGSLPITQKEAKKIADGLKMIMDEKIALLSYSGNEISGISIGVPNINEILYDLGGCKTPISLIKLLLRMRKRKWKSGRLMLLGVKEKFRKENPYLPLILVVEMWIRGKKTEYEEAELSWTLEDNEKINKIIKLMGAEKYKTYRIFEAPIH